MMKFLRRRRSASSTSRDGVPGESSGPAQATGEESGTPAARAESFWRRWDEMLPEVGSALGDSDPQRVDHQLAELVASVHPNLIFSIERGETAIYALVVSAQADPELRPYTDAWMAAAPRADTLFEYHDSIPPVPDPTEVTVNLRGHAYQLDEVRLAPQVDSEAGLVDVSVYHPGFEGLEDDAKQALTFLPLDATLGERLAADRIGRVESAEIEPQGAVGLLEFRELVRDLDNGSHSGGTRDGDTRDGGASDGDPDDSASSSR